MIDPLPLVRGEGSPEVQGSPVSRNCSRRSDGGDADIEHPAVDGIGPGAPPGNVAPGLVAHVPSHVGDAIGQREGHAGVVGPLARFQAVGSPRAKSRDFRKRAGGLELDGGAQGVPDRQAENCARRRSVCLWSSATALPITCCLHQGRCRAELSGQTCCESRPHCNTSSQARTSCRRRPSGRFPFDLATNCTLSSGHRWRLILHDALLLRVWAWWDVGATHTICYAPLRLRLTSQASKPRQAMRVSYRPKCVALVCTTNYGWPLLTSMAWAAARRHGKCGCRIGPQ